MTTPCRERRPLEYLRIEEQVVEYIALGIAQRSRSESKRGDAVVVNVNRMPAEFRAAL